jgi:hypothetical protein
LKYLLIGASLGLLVSLRPIFLLLIVLLIILEAFLAKINPEERTFLIRIVVIALILRLLFAFIAIAYIPLMYIDTRDHPVILRTLGHTIQLFRDFHREFLNGINLSRYFAGQYGDVSLKEVAREGMTSFLHLGAYIQAFLNLIFGQSLLNILVFPFISVLMVIIGYYLAKEIFNKKVAMLSSFLLAVVPSFIIWSCTNIRMSIGIISMLTIGLSLMKFSKANRLKFLLLLATSSFLLCLAKDRFAGPLLLIIIPALFLCLKIEFGKKILISILLLALFSPIAWHQRRLIDNKAQRLITDIISNQKSFATYVTGSNYKIYDEFIYSSDISKIGRISPFLLIKALPKGMAYFLFTPFPWRIYNALRLYSYPQIMFWHFSVVFSLIGTLAGLRYRFNQFLPLLMFLAFWVVLLSLVMGNEGIAARQRDLIAPFFYILASAGVIHLLGKKIFD